MRPDNPEDSNDLRKAFAYDAGHDPDPAEWLSLPEVDRHARVGAYHRRIGAPPREEGAQNAHRAIHVVVENQLAADDPPEARRTLARLRERGVSRHDAIHALGSALAEQIHGLLTGTAGAGNEAYVAGLARLDPADWLPRQRKRRVPGPGGLRGNSGA